MAKPMGQNIKKYREAAGFTQSQLGEKLGLAESTISLYESGKREPDSETQCKLADIFNVTLDELAGRPINPDTGKAATAHETRQLEQILEMNGLTFMGTPLSEDDKERIKQALELAFWDAKRKNKRKPE